MSVETGQAQIDLVMHANGLTFGLAVDKLRAALNLKEPEPIAMTVGGQSKVSALPLSNAATAGGIAARSVVVDLPSSGVQDKVGVALASGEPLEPQPPASLLNPPGILREFMDWILGCAQKPQPTLALVASLSIVATVLARKVMTQTHLRTNLYLVSVAGTAAGKDHGRKCLKLAFHFAGLGDMVGGEEIASGKGLLAAAHRQPATVFPLDEFGLMLKTVRSKSAGSHLQEIVANLMKLLSSAGSVYHGTEYANQKLNPKQDIPYPCINLHATTTPEPLFDAFSSADVASGYLNRLLILFAPNLKVPFRLVGIDPPPNHLLEWMKTAREVSQGLVGMTADNPITIRMNEGAEQIFLKFREFQEEQVETNASVGLGDLWGRCWEHASKVALVAACARHNDPKQFKQLMEQGQVFIDEDSAQWAIEFVKYVLGRMQYEVSTRVADSEFGQLVQLTHQTIRKAQRWGVTERELGRACRKFDGLPPHQRDAVLETLKRNEDAVLVEFKPQSGRGRSRKAWVATEFAPPPEDASDDRE